MEFTITKPLIVISGNTYKIKDLIKENDYFKLKDFYLDEKQTVDYITMSPKIVEDKDYEKMDYYLENQLIKEIDFRKN